MTKDTFASAAESLISPAALAFQIIPDDETALPTATKALYVGRGGDITIRTIGGTQDVLLANVVSGTVLAIRLSAVRATGTTASDLVGLA